MSWRSKFCSVSSDYGHFIFKKYKIIKMTLVITIGQKYSMLSTIFQRKYSGAFLTIDSTGNIFFCSSFVKSRLWQTSILKARGQVV